MSRCVHVMGGLLICILRRVLGSGDMAVSQLSHFNKMQVVKTTKNIKKPSHLESEWSQGVAFDTMVRRVLFEILTLEQNQE